MKLTPYIYCLALLGLIKPGFTKPDAIAQSAQALSDGMVSLTMDQEEVVFDLLRLKEATSTQQQKDMVYRIMDEESECNEVRMLCHVDTFLRNVAKGLLQNGVTEIPLQIDMDKFEQVLTRVLSLMDKEDLMESFAGLNPAILTQATKEMSSKGKHGSDYQAFDKLTLEFENLLLNHREFSPADVVAPFIIADPELKKDAIQSLIESKAFQLKPLNKYGSFYEFRRQIKDALKSSGVKTDFKQKQILVIPMNSFKQAAFLPELNSQDIIDATIAIEESNADLLDFIEFGEIMMLNQIFRSIIGDLLGVVLDLPGKLLGSGGSGSRKGSGISITIDLGGGRDDEDDDYYFDDEDVEEPVPKKKNSKPTTTKRKKSSATATSARTKATNTEISE